MVPEPGSISYQRTPAPAPARMVWAVHTVVVFSRGSNPDTAWVNRPSSVSNTLVVPGCLASAGFVYEPTVIESGPEIAGVPLLLVTVNTVIFVPVPQFGGHSMSAMLTM